MATTTVDQAKLVLNAFAAYFENNLVSKDLVTWKKFDKEMNARNALNVSEQVAPDYTTAFTTNGVADLSGGVQDSTFGSEQYKLTQTIGSSMGYGDFVAIRDWDDARKSEALKKAALRLSTDLDAYILGFAAKAGNNWIGDGDSAVGTWDDLASAYTRLMEEGVDETDLRAVLTHGDKQALGSDVVTNNASLPDVANGVYRRGFDGEVAGVATLFTQQLPALTVGTRVATGTSVTNQVADPAVNYADVCISGAPGQFMTSTINFDGQSGSVTLKDGEVFTIAGYYAYDNRAKKQLSHLQQFRVIGNYTASSGAFSNVRIFPAIITSGAYQTVVNTNSGTDGLAITHLGAAGATLHPRFIANKSAIIVSTADLMMPSTGTSRRQALSDIPVSVRLWQHSDFDTGEHMVRFDVAIEANVAANGRQKIVRVNGS